MVFNAGWNMYMATDVWTLDFRSNHLLLLGVTVGVCSCSATRALVRSGTDIR